MGGGVQWDVYDIIYNAYEMEWDEFEAVVRPECIRYTQ